MTVTSIIENTSSQGMPTEHGLSLHIHLDSTRNVLFDMGQGSLFAKNAEQMSVSIKDVDFAVISHGHYDHGGGLSTFLDINTSANVYIHKEAFLPHFSLRDTGMRRIGLDSTLADNSRLVLCGDITHICDEATLFANVDGNCSNPYGNRLLFGPDEAHNDNFCHEQNLIIEENGNVVLFAGCAHRGIINIIRKAERITGKPPTHVLAGMHLVKSGLTEEAENQYIATLATELQKYSNCKFYTMHCTGEEQYRKLKTIMGHQIDYLSCGEKIDI